MGQGGKKVVNVAGRKEVREKLTITHKWLLGGAVIY